MLLDCIGITLFVMYIFVSSSPKHCKYHSTPPCASNIRTRR